MAGQLSGMFLAKWVTSSLLLPPLPLACEAPAFKRWAPCGKLHSPSYIYCSPLVLNVASQRNKKRWYTFSMTKRKKIQKQHRPFSEYRKKNNHLKKHKIKNEKMEVRTNIWDNRVCKWEIFCWGESTLGYRDEDFLSKVAERQGEGGSDMCQQKTKQGFHSNTTKPVEFKV